MFIFCSRDPQRQTIWFAVYLSSITVLVCLNKLDECSSEFYECISVWYPHIFFFLSSFVSSTILEEEKLQQKERNRMEMRRQVTVSWDSGGSDEAPPKVRSLYATRVCVTGCLLACFCEKAKIIMIINSNCCVGASRRRTLASLQVLLCYLLTLHSHCVHLWCGIGDKSFVVSPAIFNV